MPTRRCHPRVAIKHKDGRDAETLKAFYDELGDERASRLQAVSLDLGSAYEKATAEAVSLDLGSAYEKATAEAFSAPRQCVDPFHVVQLANTAIDQARRWAWNIERRTNPRPRRPVDRPPKGSSPPPDRPRFVKHTRWSLLKDPDNLDASQREVLDRLRRQRSVLRFGPRVEDPPRRCARARFVLRSRA